MTELKTMGVREFLRGGYNEVSSPVVVVNGAEVKGTWSPGTTGLDVTYPVINAPEFRPVPKPTAKKRGTR